MPVGLKPQAELLKTVIQETLLNTRTFCTLALYDIPWLLFCEQYSIHLAEASVLPYSLDLQGLLDSRMFSSMLKVYMATFSTHYSNMGGISLRLHQPLSHMSLQQVLLLVLESLKDPPYEPVQHAVSENFFFLLDISLPSMSSWSDDFEVTLWLNLGCLPNVISSSVS